MAKIHSMTAEREHAIRAYFQENYDRAEPDYPSPLFAGRDRELESTLRSVERLFNATGPKANLTTVFYGAPGSGKSELLTQLRRRLAEMDTDPPIVVVSGGVELLTEAAAVAAAIYDALDPEGQALLRGSGWALDSVSMGFGPVGVRASRKNPPPPMSEPSRLQKVARDLSRMGRPAPTIVMMIDEAQGELQDARSRPDRFVRAMQKGLAHLKVMPVYAGLGNTMYELGECGVSRPVSDRRYLMRRLSARDVAGMAVEALSALTGQRPEIVKGWSDTIVEYAQGWPMHLNHALKAVAERAAPEWLVDDVSFREAMKSAERRRLEYYGDRLSACTELKPHMYTAWASMFDVDRPIHEGDVIAALKLSDMAAESLVKQAVKGGLVEPHPHGPMYVSPIPSLLDHIRTRGRAAQVGIKSPAHPAAR